MKSMMLKTEPSNSHTRSTLATRGHGRGYAPDSSKLRATLGWNADSDLPGGLAHVDEQTGKPEETYTKLITFVPDRPGHDRRYALEMSPLARGCSRRSSREFGTLLAATVSWVRGRTGETGI
jgi:dTDP-D-glucose 4,6-dehydratase